MGRLLAAWHRTLRGFFMVAAKNRVIAISFDSIDFPSLDPSDTRATSSVLQQLPLEMVLPFCVSLACSHATGEIELEPTPCALAYHTFVAHETEGIPIIFFCWIPINLVDAVFSHTFVAWTPTPCPIFVSLPPFRLEKFRVFQETRHSMVL